MHELVAAIDIPSSVLIESSQFILRVGSTDQSVNTSETAIDHSRLIVLKQCTLEA